MRKSKYEKLLAQRKKEYTDYKECYCPAIREYVIFNSKGFKHLRFKTDGTPRNPAYQMHKFGLLPLVIPTIKSATSVERYERRMAPIGAKRRDGKRIRKEVQYWAMVAVVGKQNVKVKVVLRKVGTGATHFWSVMKLGENLKTP